MRRTGRRAPEKRSGAAFAAFRILRRVRHETRSRCARRSALLAREWVSKAVLFRRPCQKCRRRTRRREGAGRHFFASKRAGVFLACHGVHRHAFRPAIDGGGPLVNFASDNGAGAAPQILAAIAAASQGPAAAYGADACRATRLYGSGEISRPDLAAFLVPRARRPMRWRFRRLPGRGRRSSATKNPTSTTTNAARPNSSPAAPSWSAFRIRWQDHAEALQETLPVSRATRQILSAGCVDVEPGHRGGHGLHARGNPRAD